MLETGIRGYASQLQFNDPSHIGFDTFIIFMNDLLHMICAVSICKISKDGDRAQIFVLSCLFDGNLCMKDLLFDEISEVVGNTAYKFAGT